MRVSKTLTLSRVPAPPQCQITLLNPAPPGTQTHNRIRKQNCADSLLGDIAPGKKSAGSTIQASAKSSTNLEASPLTPRGAMANAVLFTPIHVGALFETKPAHGTSAGSIT
jgi:hypothetical protein